ncbi:MAG: tetratricopeptide repeat protein [Polyangiaceae bacterium]
MRSPRPAFLAAALASLLAATAAEAADKGPPETADSLYNQGNEAYDHGDYALALQLYSSAFQLRKSYDIARNLGLTELKLGKLRDAIGHFTYSLAQYPSNRADTKKQVTEWLAQAKASVGTIKLTVDPETATCSLNGVELTREERDADLPADPGDNVIECAADGYRSLKHAARVTKGGTEIVEIALKRRTSDVDPPPPPPPPEQPKLSAYHRAWSYDARRKVAWTGVGVGSALVVGGVVSAVLSATTASDADTLLADLRKRTGRDFPCAGAGVARCSDLVDQRRTQDLTGNLAIWTLAAGAVIGTFTMAYLWPPDDPPKSPVAPEKPKAALSVGPGGVLITGSF